VIIIEKHESSRILLCEVAPEHVLDGSSQSINRCQSILAPISRSMSKLIDDYLDNRWPIPDEFHQEVVNKCDNG
jgi:hypothetical protein